MLIVEDHDWMRSAMREFLQLAYRGSRILEAADGASAIAACREHDFRLVLLDLNLPDANGIELIAPIKALRPSCQVIVVSHFAAARYSERCLAAGAFAYVTKDEIFRELTPAIDRASRARGSP